MTFRTTMDTNQIHLNTLLAKKDGAALLTLIRSKVSKSEFDIIANQIKKLVTLSNVVSIVDICRQINRLDPQTLLSFLAFLNDDEPLVQRELFHFAEHELNDDEFHTLFDLSPQTIIKLINTRTALLSNTAFQQGMRTPLQILFEMVSKIYANDMNENAILNLLDDPTALIELLNDEATFCETPNALRSPSAQQPLTPVICRSGSPVFKSGSANWRTASTDSLQTLHSRLRHGRTVSSSE